jgi:hypothetical protein
MPVRKQSVSFSDTAFDYAQALVDAGEYPTISAAVSGELVRAKAGRERRAELFAAEVERRLALPPDQWLSLGELGEVTRGARERLAKLRRGESG